MAHSEKVSNYLIQSAKLIEKSAELSTDISFFADVMIKSIKAGNKILWCGNGGSAADSQHLAAELVGRFKFNRNAINSIALTTDTSILTAIGNDFGFDNVFSRQIQAIGKSGDVLVAMTTSGRSQNILKAIDMANETGITTILFTGKSAPKSNANHELKVDSDITEQVQQCHTSIGHIICEIVEAECSN